MGNPPSKDNCGDGKTKVLVYFTPTTKSLSYHSLSGCTLRDFAL